MSKKYYAERHGAKIEPLDLETLKLAFLAVFEELSKDLYFLEATGYECVDAGKVLGSWGENPEAFFFVKLRLRDTWPIQEKIRGYDEPKLFSVIEFLYDYVSKPTNKWYHGYFQCGWHATTYDKELGKSDYRREINSLLKDYKVGYELSEAGEILQIPPSGLEPIVVEAPVTTEPKNIDDRVKAAILKYRRYGSSIDDKKDAVRTLADVLEFLRKEGIKLTEKDDDDLFRIINCFDIRHHNREQQGGYDKEVWYDWMFYTFLSSINALLKLKNKYDLKL
jgi:hypothetical protein